MAFLSNTTQQNQKNRQSVRPKRVASAPLSFMDLENRVVMTAGLTADLGDGGDLLSETVQVSTETMTKTQETTTEATLSDDGTADLFSQNAVLDAGTLVVDGTYTLSNHPGFGYGLQLNNLIVPNENTATTYQFDFNAAESDLKMIVDGTTVRIVGDVFGGRILDGTSEFDPNDSGLWHVDFTYDNVQDVGHDDDKEVPRADGDFGSGTLTQLYGPELSFDIVGASGETFAFRLGNQDDDQGYLGFPGISGWGWLDHRIQGEGGEFKHVGGSDWNFIAELDELAGGQGLTPGFWKQEHHFEFWPDAYSPDMLYADVFQLHGEVDPNLTLLDALNAKGGGESALMRHSVAALLNAASDGVDYAFTELQVISQVQLAYQSGAFEPVKDAFEEQNELGGADLKGN